MGHGFWKDQIWVPEMAADTAAMQREFAPHLMSMDLSWSIYRNYTYSSRDYLTLDHGDNTMINVTVGKTIILIKLPTTENVRHPTYKNGITGWWFQPLPKMLVNEDGYSQYMQK